MVSGVEYPKDSQGYQWSKQGDTWYYWNGEAWLPGTPPAEIAPAEKKPFPTMLVVAAIVVLLAIGAGAYYFVFMVPPAEVTGVCACLSEGCQEKALVLEVPEEAAEYAKQLGVMVEGNRLVAEGTEYYDGTTTIAVTGDAAALEVYRQVLLFSAWDEVSQGPMSVYKKEGTTVVIKGGVIVVGPNALEVIGCAYLP